MANTLSFDSRGRITIPHHLRAGLGDHVVAVLTPHGVVLHPVPVHVDLPTAAKDVSGEDAALEET